MAVTKRTWTTASGETREAWKVDYYDRDGTRQIKQGFERKKDAEAYYEKNRVDVRAGTHVSRSKSKTVAEAGSAWVRAAKDEGLERSTVEGYEAHLRLHIAPVLGPDKICDLNTDDIKAFRSGLLKGGMSSAMVGKVMFSLGAILKEGGRPNLIREAIDNRRQRRLGDHRTKRDLEVGVDIPTPHEITTILNHAQPHWHAFFLVAAMTGLRASELRGLRWSDVDLDASRLTVRQKLDKWKDVGAPKAKASKRTIPFGKYTLNTLKRWKLACPHSSMGLVFPNGVGKPHSLSTIRRPQGKMMRAAGMIDHDGNTKYTGMHPFRHFFASWCISRNLNAKVIQTRMGHAKITETFDTYGHLFPVDENPAEIEAAELAVLAA
jgi:integrase